MLKKFISQAVMSLVMEKGAREKLAQIREAKKKSASAIQNNLLQGGGILPQPKQKPAKKRKIDEEPPNAGLLEALSRLDDALENGPLKPNAKIARKGKNMTQRQLLIRQALATQRSKAKILENLSAEDRLRLHLMAKKMMLPDKE